MYTPRKLSDGESSDARILEFPHKAKNMFMNVVLPTNNVIEDFEAKFSTAGYEML